MRGVVIALLALVQFSSVAFASETIVAGDSDHTYLPVDNEREVLLHEFTYNTPPVAESNGYTTWSGSGQAFNANCLPQYGEQSDLGMNETNKQCTLAANRFQAPKMFRLTRVVYRASSVGPGTGNSWAEMTIRVVTVSASGTIVEIGSEQALNGGVGSLTIFNLAVDVPTTLGVGIQMRAVQVAYEDVNTFPTVELWGIWK